MSQRESKLVWLKDLLGHLRSCQQELEWAENGTNVQLLTETMLRDLENCRRICEELRRRSSLQHVA